MYKRQGVEYTNEEIKELREYAAAKNAYMKKYYEDNIALGHHPAVQMCIRDSFYGFRRATIYNIKRRSDWKDWFSYFSV